ncbi:MAG TPA: hypothetical protein VHK88_14820 [Aquihabitans sp.]|jgi:hypothetical protein|nr:hypothetical protein [Aquihabitans sp.]
MFRRRRDAESVATPAADPVAALDLAAVPPRLVAVVQGAVEARHRWGAVVAGLAPGPLADRLTELGARIDAGVADVHATAVRVGEAERVLAALDVDGATAAFKAARRRAADGDPPPELEALEARFTSVQRILNSAAEAEERLRVLDARLLAAVARGAEVALTADGDALRSLGDDLDGVVSELGALRSALSSLR